MEYLRQKTQPDVKYVSSVTEFELILQREKDVAKKEGRTKAEHVSIILGLFPKIGSEESADGPFQWAKKWYREKENERVFDEIKVELAQLQNEINNSSDLQEAIDFRAKFTDLRSKLSGLQQQHRSDSKDESPLRFKVFKDFARKFNLARFYVTESQALFDLYDIQVRFFIFIFIYRIYFIFSTYSCIILNRKTPLWFFRRRIR